MKHNLKILSGFIAVIWITYSAEAGAFGSLFDDLKKTIEERTNAEETQPETRAAETAYPSNVVNSFFGEGRDVHEYEGALSPEDEYCARIVEPFTLTDNASDILKDVAADAGTMVFDMVINGGARAPGKDELLKAAKAKAKKMNWMPMGQEVQYGRALHEQRLNADDNLFERSKRRRVKRLYAKADAILDRVLSEINEDHPYKFQLFLINDDEINAEALPGGYLYVNTGVLDSEYAELVFAHEIAHVLKRHQTRETQARLIDSVDTYKDLKALIDNPAADPVLVAKRAALLHGLFLNYSRQQELQADACSVRLSQRILGYDVNKLIDPYISSLSTDVSPDTEPRSRSANHPDYPQRGERMREVALSKRSSVR